MFPWNRKNISECEFNSESTRLFKIEFVNKKIPLLTCLGVVVCVGGLLWWYHLNAPQGLMPPTVASPSDPVAPYADAAGNSPAQVQPPSAEVSTNGQVSRNDMAKADPALMQPKAEIVAQAAGSNRSQPHFSGQAPGEAQTILHQLKGSISAVDAKAMTLTIKSGDGAPLIFKITAKTKFSRSGKPAAFKDADVGSTVEVVVNSRAQSDEAITVNIMAE